MSNKDAVVLAVVTGAALVVVVCSRRWMRRRRADTAAAPAEVEAALAEKEETAIQVCPRMSKKRQASEPCITVVPQTMLPARKLEYSVHRPSRLLRKEIEIVFRPDLEAVYLEDPRGAKAGVDKEEFLRRHLLAIPTWQPAERDLSEMSFDVNQERRELLARFDAFADPLRAALRSSELSGFWSDVSCPMEGHSRYGTPTSAIYNELEGLTQLLRYDAVPVGCCGIVLHPIWGRKAYPVTLFTVAPLEALAAAVSSSEALAAKEGS